MIWPLSRDNRPFGAAVKPNCRATIREMTRDKTKMSRDTIFAKRNVSAGLPRNRGKMSRDNQRNCRVTIGQIVAWQSKETVAWHSEKLSRDNQGPSASETQPPCSFFIVMTLWLKNCLLSLMSSFIATALHSGPHRVTTEPLWIAAVRPSFCRKIPSLFLPSTVLTHGIPRSNIIITKKEHFPKDSVFTSCFGGGQLWPN